MRANARVSRDASTTTSSNAPPANARSRPKAPQSSASLGLACHGGLESGRPLDAGVRARTESLLGIDFSGVRVHTGPAAARLTGEVGARAVTVGDDVAFAPGQYAPGTSRGDALITHELAHVAQAQRSGVWPAGGVSEPGQAAEVEADRAATSVMANRPAYVMARPAARVMAKRWVDAPASELTALSVPSTKFNISDKALAEYFKVMESGNFSTTLPAPQGVKVELHGIDSGHLTPMTSIAMHMARQTYASPATGNQTPLFGPGTTVMAHLALAKYNVADGDYRFTWTGSSSSGTLYIELVTGSPAAQNTPTATAPASGEQPEAPVEAGKEAPAGTKITVGSLSFKLTNTWAAARFGHLRQALSLIPESALKEVDGLEFEVNSGGGNTGEDGHYLEEEHRVVIFDSAWDKTAARYGGVEWPVFAIVHEIGHAVDRAPLRKAWDTYAASSGTKKDEEKLTRARSASGLRYVKVGKDFEQQLPLKGTDGDFRTAAAKDGVKLPKGASNLTGGPTEYSNNDWEDVYAESFALYITDPELLKRIRPRLYEYFSKRYPPAATTP